MMDNLQRCEVIIVNACPMCLADEETLDYFLIVISTSGLELVLGWFDCSRVLLQSLDDLFEVWKLGVGSSMERVMLRSSSCSYLYNLEGKKSLKASVIKWGP